MLVGPHQHFRRCTNIFWNMLHFISASGWEHCYTMWWLYQCLVTSCVNNPIGLFNPRFMITLVIMAIQFAPAVILANALLHTSSTVPGTGGTWKCVECWVCFAVCVYTCVRVIVCISSLFWTNTWMCVYPVCFVPNIMIFLVVVAVQYMYSLKLLYAQQYVQQLHTWKSLVQIDLRSVKTSQSPV